MPVPLPVPNDSRVAYDRVDVAHGRVDADADTSRREETPQIITAWFKLHDAYPSQLPPDGLSSELARCLVGWCKLKSAGDPWIERRLVSKG